MNACSGPPDPLGAVGPAAGGGGGGAEAAGRTAGAAMAGAFGGPPASASAFSKALRAASSRPMRASTVPRWFQVSALRGFLARARHLEPTGDGARPHGPG